jgi:predicted CopG family antitoxin
MTIHYGFVDIAIKQEVRDLLREVKGEKSYSRFISELLEK